MTFSRQTLAPAAAQSMSGGTATAARSAGLFGVSSHSGCPHLWSGKTIPMKHWRMPCSSASRFTEVELHFNKGLAGAPPEVIESAKGTAMNPAVCGAFALAIVADGQGPAVPRNSQSRARRCQGPQSRRNRAPLHERTPRHRLRRRSLHVSESNFFEPDFEQSYWGANHARLAEIKKKYDPDGLFLSTTESGPRHTGPQTASPGSELPARFRASRIQAQWSLQYQLLGFAGYFHIQAGVRHRVVMRFELILRHDTFSS